MVLPAASLSPRVSLPVPLWRRVLFHPLMAVPLVACLYAGVAGRDGAVAVAGGAAEAAVPADGVFLTDGEGRLLESESLLGVGQAHLTRVFHQVLEQGGGGGGEVAAAAEVLKRVRSAAAERRQPLPELIRLHRSSFERRPDGVLTERSHSVTDG